MFTSWAEYFTVPFAPSWPSFPLHDSTECTSQLQWICSDVWVAEVLLPLRCVKQVITKTCFKCCSEATAPVSCLALPDLDPKETAQGLLSWLHLPAQSTEERKKALSEAQQGQSRAGTGISTTSHSTAGLCMVVRHRHGPEPGLGSCTAQHVS